MNKAVKRQFEKAYEIMPNWLQNDYYCLLSFIHRKNEFIWRQISHSTMYVMTSKCEYEVYDLN